MEDQKFFTPEKIVTKFDDAHEETASASPIEWQPGPAFTVDNDKPLGAPIPNRKISADGPSSFEDQDFPQQFKLATRGDIVNEVFNSGVRKQLSYN